MCRTVGGQKFVKHLLLHLRPHGITFARRTSIQRRVSRSSPMTASKDKTIDKLSRPNSTLFWRLKGRCLLEYCLTAMGCCFKVVLLTAQITSTSFPAHIDMIEYEPLSSGHSIIPIYSGCFSKLIILPFLTVQSELRKFLPGSRLMFDQDDVIPSRSGGRRRLSPRLSV